MNFIFIFIEEKEVDGFVNNDKNDEDKYDGDEDNFIMNMLVLDDFLFIFQVLIVLKFINNNKGNVFIRKRKTEVKVFIFFKRRFIFKVIFLNLDLFKVKLKVKVKFGKIFVRLKR